MFLSNSKCASEVRLFLIYRKIETQVPDSLPLDAEEIRHIRARRLSPGAAIFLGDGLSRRWRGFLSQNGREFILDIPADVVIRKEPSLSLYTAVPDGRRWFWLLQKATELGVSDIFPVLYRRSNPHSFSKARAQRVILEAAAQSRRFFLPNLHPAVAFGKLSEKLPSGVCPVLFDGRGETDFPLSEAAIVGPEGGFSEEELSVCKEIGWPVASLGGNVLRVETAAIAALSVLTVIPSFSQKPP